MFYRVLDGLVVTPNNLVAAAIVVQYWTDVVPVGAWIAIFIGIIVAINMVSH